MGIGPEARSPHLVRGPFALAHLVGVGQHPYARFTTIGDAVDGAHGRLLLDMEAGPVHVGGVDVFDLDVEGRVRRVWSAGGQRSMRS